MGRAKANAVEKVAPLKTAPVAKIAARAASTSTRLENRGVPAGHVRTSGVKKLLAERQARKR